MRKLEFRDRAFAMPSATRRTTSSSIELTGFRAGIRRHASYTPNWKRRVSPGIDLDLNKLEMQIAVYNYATA